MNYFDKVNLLGNTVYVKDTEARTSVQENTSDIAENKQNIASNTQKIIQNTEDIKNIKEQLEVPNTLYISIKKYGAIGDYTADDTSAIQTAINENTGNVVFIPKGTYKITSTITIPPNTYIMGAGRESVIKAVSGISFDVFQTVNFNESTGRDNHDSHSGRFVLENFVIDGNCFDRSDFITKSGNRQSGRGIAIYGHNYKLINMDIVNNPDNGVWLESNTYDTDNYFRPLENPAIIDKCNISYNGKENIIFERAFDVQISACYFNGPSRSAKNQYDNIKVINGNFRMVNSHAGSPYGEYKAKYTLEIGENCEAVSVVNSHIEGGYNNLLLYKCARCMFTNCQFYSVFGDYNIVLSGANGCYFSNCIMLGQAGDDIPAKPTFNGTFNFKNEGKENSENNFTVYLNGVIFTDSLTNYGGLNNADITGFAEKVVDGLEDNNSNWLVHGSFGDQSEYSCRTGSMKTTSGLTGSPTAVIGATMQGDSTFYTGLVAIAKYTSGTAYFGQGKKSIPTTFVNGTDSAIPVVINGATINGQASYSAPPHSTTIFVGDGNGNYFAGS